MTQENNPLIDSQASLDNINQQEQITDSKSQHTSSENKAYQQISDIEQDPDFIKQTKLPKVSMKIVFLFAFNFPIFIWPLLVLLTSSLKPLSSTQEFLSNVFSFMVWIYPIVFILITIVLWKLMNKNERLGIRIVLLLTLLEFIGLMVFLAYIIK